MALVESVVLRLMRLIFFRSASPADLLDGRPHREEEIVVIGDGLVVRDDPLVADEDRVGMGPAHVKAQEEIGLSHREPLP